MVAVTLHKIGEHNIAECLALQVRPDQIKLVASVQKSISQAQDRSGLHPYAIYDARSRGCEHPTEPVIGFAMYELVSGIGFIERILIDHQWQNKGYGKATLMELIRRLKLIPDVELIATSHRKENAKMAGLCRNLGFVPWAVPFQVDDLDEIYLRLKDAEGFE